ncbi:uncharacterized protein LOC142162661 [Nicotiana tabacum]|uniref:Uncharacterized protein LOC142162661 n=1 Tax=Nicotiana tabacum TaxID=4097 RepID=A0AC58RR98_TOBAC
METETEFANECLLLNSLRRSDSQWIIKVLLIQCEVVKEFKNETNQGLRWTLIFVDEEGTKMQAILFTDQVNMWKEYLEQGSIYYIINIHINDRKPNFQSVHKEFEIVFSNNTIVKRCNNPFSTVSFSNSFVSFEEAFQCTNGTIFGNFFRFPSLDKNASCYKYMTERAILASRNEYVDQLNKMLISKFPGESKTFISFDSAKNDTNNYYQEEYLSTLTPNDLPPHRNVVRLVKRERFVLVQQDDPRMKKTILGTKRWQISGTIPHLPQNLDISSSRLKMA